MVFYKAKISVKIYDLSLEYIKRSNLNLGVNMAKLFLWQWSIKLVSVMMWNSMNKIITLCLLAVIIGAFPVYAADSSNATINSGISNMNPSAFEQIKNAVIQIQNINPNLASDVNGLKAAFMRNNLQIDPVVKNVDVQNLIADMLQNKNFRYIV